MCEPIRNRRLQSASIKLNELQDMAGHDAKIFEFNEGSRYLINIVKRADHESLLRLGAEVAKLADMFKNNGLPITVVLSTEPLKIYKMEGAELDAASLDALDAEKEIVPVTAGQSGLAPENGV